MQKWIFESMIHKFIEIYGRIEINTAHESDDCGCPMKTAWSTQTTKTTTKTNRNWIRLVCAFLLVGSSKNSLKIHFVRSSKFIYLFSLYLLIQYDWCVKKTNVWISEPELLKKHYTQQPTTTTATTTTKKMSDCEFQF